MKNKFLILSPDDYDFYTIPLPFEVLIKRQENLYFSSQLEKLHPCFSDDCSYDWHLKIQKNKLLANVLVMQKYKVARYKANKKALYIKEDKSGQFFLSKKQRETRLLAGIFLAAGLLLSSIFLSTFFSRQKGETELRQTTSVLQEETPNPAFPPKYTTPEILNYIAAHNGRLSSLLWSYDSYTENAGFKLHALYPEDLQPFEKALKLSPMTFEDSLPLITVSLSSKLLQPQAATAELQPKENENYKAQIRQLLLDNNFILIEESLSPYGLKLSLPLEQSSGPNALEELTNFFEYLAQRDFPISKIQLSSAARTFNIEIIFSQVPLLSQQDLYKSLLANLNIFMPEAAAPPGTSQKSPQKPAPKPAQKLSKVGQIIKEDGSIDIYYKDENGKIIKG